MAGNFAIIRNVRWLYRKKWVNPIDISSWSPFLTYFWWFFRSNSRQTGNNRILYHGLDAKIERMSEWIHFGLVKVVSFGTIGFGSIVTLVFYFILDRGNDPYMDLSFMIPFSWESPYGYFLLLIFSAIDCFCSTTACTATICLFIGSSYVLITVAEDITNDLDHLNSIDSTNPNERQINKKFTDIVRLYASLEELSDNFIWWPNQGWKFNYSFLA